MKTYTIKPLEWKTPAWASRSSMVYIEAKPVEGITYSVEEIGGKFQWLWGPPRFEDTLSAAKSAAEAHYRARIEQALVPVESEAGIPDPAEAIRKAREAMRAALRLRGAANQEGGHYATKDYRPQKLHAICEGIEDQLRQALAALGGEEEEPEREKPAPKPIGKCPRCFTPFYSEFGFCGVCDSEKF